MVDNKPIFDFIGNKLGSNPRSHKKSVMIDWSLLKGLLDASQMLSEISLEESWTNGDGCLCSRCLGLDALVRIKETIVAGAELDVVE